MLRKKDQAWSSMSFPKISREENQTNSQRKDECLNGKEILSNLAKIQLHVTGILGEVSYRLSVRDDSFSFFIGFSLFLSP